MLKWEEINCNTFRLKVPKGWIIKSLSSSSYHYYSGVHMIFIEDIDHQWEIEDEK